MIHDPLCPWVGIPPHFCTTTANIEYASPAACWCKEGDIPCLCSLIAKVRADQRECCVAVIEEVAKDTSDPQLLIAAILEKS